ncbi:MAG: family 20 glycosylhydrolase [Oscillospiraceae bacterium]|nr:family 20 glycosylhydrolase [Oscillospiraceae bacterium]
MFFTPIERTVTGEKLSFTAQTVVSAPVAYIERQLSEAFNVEGIVPCRSVSFCYGQERGEAYTITLAEDTVVSAGTQRGLMNGYAALLDLLSYGETEQGIVTGEPVCPVRGYRTFLPDREGLADFKAVVDLLVRYQYSTIILEIGGAMEYKRHPEINETWVEYCKDTRSYSGRSREIQHGLYPWRKNSIHCDNGNGSFLTQEECRDLAAYCRERGLEIVPECPTLSHCDYLVMAHPEIREREGDAYPDAYCPNHPDTYGLVFDILDEVMDVFAPKMIHIGHDELYSIGVCPRCCGQKPHELYVQDIKKIKGYLDSKGVRTSMWGEKLLNSYDHDGKPVGGTGNRYEKNGGICEIPNLYPCRDLLPEGILYIHWYWVFDDAYDNVYHERGFDMAFGNLYVIQLKKWKDRVSRGALGGWIGNWGGSEDEYMQRNCQYFDLMAGAYAFCCRDYDDDKKPWLVQHVMEEAYRWHSKKIDNPIRFLHTTNLRVAYDYFYDGLFIEDEKFLMGQYELTYADGTKAYLPVKFGTHIGHCRKPTEQTQLELFQLSAGTLPQMLEDLVVYECSYEDPFPEKELDHVEYVPIMKECQVNFCLLPDGDRSQLTRPLPECTYKATGRYDALIDGFVE